MTNRSSLSASLRALLLVVLAAGLCAPASAQTLTEPRGGEVYKANTKQVITFVPGTTLGGDVSYDNQQTWEGVFNFNNSGKSNIKYRDTNSTQCYVRLFTQDATTGAKSVVEASAAPFTVWSNTGVKFKINDITSSTKWHQDSIVTITWSVLNASTYAPDSVMVQIYADSGLSATTVSKNLGPEVTQYDWKVWRRPADGVRVQLITSDKNASTASPSAYFAITGATVNWKWPATGNTAQVGVTDTLQWDYTDGFDGPVKLEFNDQGGSPNAWKTLDSNLSKATRTFVWSPPRSTALAQFRLTYDSGFVKMLSPKFTIAAVGVNDGGMLPAMSLEQNYPNPFSAALNNGVTSIPFSLSHGANVSLRVFDVLGRVVAQTPNTWFDAGHNEVRFDANGLAPGLYGYQLAGSPVQRLMIYTR